MWWLLNFDMISVLINTLIKALTFSHSENLRMAKCKVFLWNHFHRSTGMWKCFVSLKGTFKWMHVLLWSFPHTSISNGPNLPFVERVLVVLHDFSSMMDGSSRLQSHPLQFWRPACFVPLLSYLWITNHVRTVHA